MCYFATVFTSPPFARNEHSGETCLMASVAPSISQDVIGGIELPIVQVCFTWLFIPQSAYNLAISRMCLYCFTRGFSLRVSIVVGVRRTMFFTFSVLIQTNLIYCKNYLILYKRFVDGSCHSSCYWWLLRKILWKSDPYHQCCRFTPIYLNQHAIANAVNLCQR